MTEAIILKLCAVLALVALNGFFVAAEFALVKVRDSQLDNLVRKGSRRARVARLVTEHLDASLSACQLGITLASLALGWIGEPVFADLVVPVLAMLKIESHQVQHTLSFLVGFTVLTFLHITAGEQAPKWLAIQNPLPTTLWIAMPLHWFHRISYPFIWVLNHSALWMLRQVGINPSEGGEHGHSQEELRLLLADSQKRESATGHGRNIVLNAMDLKELRARDVMRPRREIVALNHKESFQQCLETAQRTRFSRFPICEEGDLDRTLAVIHIKDIYARASAARSVVDLLPWAKRLVYVPETARLERVLNQMLEGKHHFAIVIDEYGTTMGMLTLENLLEEIVGPIHDGFEVEKQLMVQLSENIWEIDGLLPLHVLSEQVGQSLQAEGVTTVGGWVTSQLGGFPREGASLLLERHELIIKEVEGPRVAKLTLMRKPAKLPE